MAVVDRASRFTVEQAKIEYYSDFLTDFDKNPLTGYLARVTNEESVKQSIKSLLLTNRTERFFQPYIGSKLQSLLFEPNDPLTNITLEQEIKTTLQNGEPRAKIETIRITNGQDFDENNIYVTLVFSLVNVPNEVFTTDIILNRRR